MEISGRSQLSIPPTRFVMADRSVGHPGDAAPVRMPQGGVLILWGGFGAAGLSAFLNWRAGHAPIGAEHAAIPGFGFQDRLAAFAVIEELARVRRHALGRLMPAFRAGDCGRFNYSRFF